MKFILYALIAMLAISCSSIKTSDRSQERVIQPRPIPPPKTQVPSIPPEKLFEVGRKMFDQKEFNKSYDYFLAAANAWIGKPREPEALIWADRALIKSLRFHDAIELTKNLLSTKKWPDSLFSELTGYLVRSYEGIGDLLLAISESQNALNQPALAKEFDFYRSKISEIIEGKLTVSELEKISDERSLGDFRAKALLRRGEIAYETKDFNTARNYFEKTLSSFSQTESGSKAKEYLYQLDSLNRVEPYTIGVILPMSGKHSAVSQKTIRGIQVGLGLYNNNQTQFKLAIVDSEGNPDMARRGVERLVREDNTIAIIGSLLSKTATAVASKTSELGVPSIALSQKSGITESGSGVFRNALTSEMQIRTLVKTAMEKQGLKNFAIMYPNDPYGIEFANLFWDEVLARGGRITAAQSYTNKETDFRYPVQRLINTYYIEARADEYRLRIKDWTDAQKRVTTRTTPPEDLLPPMVDFEALFIPDNIKAMGQISAMLSFNGVKGIKLLGTNLWNTPGIAKRAGHFSNNLLFVDTLIGAHSGSELSSEKASHFNQDYKALFNEEPGVFELQGYDSALILKQLIAQGNITRESLTSALLSAQNIPGAAGILSMSAEKEIVRPLTPLTLDTAGNITPLK